MLFCNLIQKVKFKICLLSLFKGECDSVCVYALEQRLPCKLMSEAFVVMMSVKLIHKTKVEFSSKNVCTSKHILGIQSFCAVTFLEMSSSLSLLSAEQVGTNKQNERDCLLV